MTDLNGYGAVAPAGGMNYVHIGHQPLPASSGGL